MSPFISNSGKVNASLASCFMAEILLLTATMLVVRPHPSFFIMMIISNQVGHFENLTKAGKQRRGGQGRRRRGGAALEINGRDGFHQLSSLPVPQPVLRFVPCCPLKNEKGRRQHPFTIHHYSPYTSQLVSMEMLLLLEYPGCRRISARQKAAMEGDFFPATPGTACGVPTQASPQMGRGALAGCSPLGLAKGACLSLKQRKQPCCTKFLQQWGDAPS